MTLAYNDRYKLYQPVVSTTDFLLDFPIFDDDDIEVRVDGAATTAFSITSSYSDGRAEGAMVVLNSGVTDVNVELFGKKPYSRGTDYGESSPNFTNNIQNDVDEIAAIIQEIGRDIDRSDVFITIGDDAVGSIPAPINSGVVHLTCDPLSNTRRRSFSDKFYYHAGSVSPVTESLVPSGLTFASDVEHTTGSLTGTSGSDAKVTVSPQATGFLQIENRSGAGRTFRANFT